MSVERSASPSPRSVDRRDALKSIGVSIALAGRAQASAARLPRPVKIGLIADLHHDIMHDGPARLGAFIEAMQTDRPDAIMQLGDFAYPNGANMPVLNAFRAWGERAFHVLGNHEIDDGHSFDEVAESWQMPGRYYAAEIEGLHLIVLDGNERPVEHQGGYPAHVGDAQLQWLSKTLSRIDGPAIVVSHQPLAGPASVDNADEVMALINGAADKVLLAINGHTHIDAVIDSPQVPAWHVNSASYYWVGAQFRHDSYPREIHNAHPWISCTCPYRDPLFAVLTVDPKSRTMEIEGRESGWVGASPEQIGIPPSANGANRRQIAPLIRRREL